MSEYIINEVGSSTITLPSKILKNDTLVFNITNSDIATKYTGTMLTYSFPFDCNVRLEVAGARGGKGNKCTDNQVGKGALLKGDFTFFKGDTLLICVGQAGTDHGGSTGDGTTGAGGGGTFIVQRSLDNTGDLITDTGAYKDWRVKPLAISAGGNGSRDVGYSGTGTVYHGLATEGKAPTYAEYSGGGYNASHTTTNAGKSFLSGASGATASYSRGGTSYAGFGCGGGNKDDGEGGGGGGYFGGTTSSSASSFISDEATNVERVDGYNFGEGYFKITFLSTGSINAKCKVNGEIKSVSSMKIKVNGVWKEVTEIKSKVNGVWK